MKNCRRSFICFHFTWIMKLFSPKVVFIESLLDFKIHHSPYFFPGLTGPHGPFGTYTDAVIPFRLKGIFRRNFSSFHFCEREYSDRFFSSEMHRKWSGRQRNPKFPLQAEFHLQKCQSSFSVFLWATAHTGQIPKRKDVGLGIRHANLSLQKTVPPRPHFLAAKLRQTTQKNAGGGGRVSQKSSVNSLLRYQATIAKMFFTRNFPSLYLF